MHNIYRNLLTSCIVYAVHSARSMMY